MNKRRIAMLQRKRRVGRGALALQRPYQKPEVGYDLSVVARRKMFGL